MKEKAFILHNKHLFFSLNAHNNIVQILYSEYFRSKLCGSYKPTTLLN